MSNHKRTLSYIESKQLKHQLLNDGSFQKYKAYRKLSNQLKLEHSIEQIDEHTGQLYKVPTFEYYQIIEQLQKELIDEISPFGFHHCQQIENNSYNRVERLRKRLANMLESDNDTYFITFTFDDEYIDKLNDKTKREYVSCVLKQKATDYVANVDYGGTSEYIDSKGQLRTATGRIHFHALANNTIEKDDWAYGFISSFKVRKSTQKEKMTSLGSLPPYLDKFTKHAIKKSTNNLRPIYSRNTNREGE